MYQIEFNGGFGDRLVAEEASIPSSFSCYERGDDSRRSRASTQAPGSGEARLLPTAPSLFCSLVSDILDMTGI